MSTQHLAAALAALGIQPQWKGTTAAFELQAPRGRVVSVLADHELGVLRLRALNPYPPHADAQRLADRIALGAAWGLGRVYFDPWERRWVVAVGVPVPAPVSAAALQTALGYLYSGWIAVRQEQVPKAELPPAPAGLLDTLRSTLGRSPSELSSEMLTFARSAPVGVGQLRCFVDRELLFVEAIAWPVRRAPPTGETMLQLNQLNAQLRIGSAGLDLASGIARVSLALPAVSVAHAPRLAHWMVDQSLAQVHLLPGQ